MRNRGKYRAHLTCGAILCFLLVPTLAGCGVGLHGDWHLVRSVPNRDVFAVDDAHFGRDGSFTARTTIEGKTNNEAGTFKFNGFHLTLRPHAGGQRKYNAMIKFGKLEILDKGRKAVLAKGKRADKE